MASSGAFLPCSNPSKAPYATVTLHGRMLAALHENHFGVERMKALARPRFWFPGIDKRIEDIAKACEHCAILGKMPTKAPLHSWEPPKQPWQRLHMDFCGPVHNSMWLIVVDALTKWPGAIKMSSTTSGATIQKLDALFATHGFPEQIVSDNGPQFASKEFAQYCKENGINITLTPPYHPNSNGQAERYVQTFKEYQVAKCMSEKSGPIEKIVNRILREVPCYSTPSNRKKSI